MRANTHRGNDCDVQQEGPELDASHLTQALEMMVACSHQERSKKTCFARFWCRNHICCRSVAGKSHKTHAQERCIVLLCSITLVSRTQVGRGYKPEPMAFAADTHTIQLKNIHRFLGIWPASVSPASLNSGFSLIACLSKLLESEHSISTLSSLCEASIPKTC